MTKDASQVPLTQFWCGLADCSRPWAKTTAFSTLWNHQRLATRIRATSARAFLFLFLTRRKETATYVAQSIFFSPLWFVHITFGDYHQWRITEDTEHVTCIPPPLTPQTTNSKHSCIVRVKHTREVNEIFSGNQCPTDKSLPRVLTTLKSTQRKTRQQNFTTNQAKFLKAQRKAI